MRIEESEESDANGRAVNLNMYMISSLKTCLTMKSQKKRNSEEFYDNTDFQISMAIGMAVFTSGVRVALLACTLGLETARKLG